MGQTIMFDTLV